MGGGKKGKRWYTRQTTDGLNGVAQRSDGPSQKKMHARERRI